VEIDDRRPPIAGPHFQLYSSRPGAGVNWRLLSGNNRDLGRGCLFSDDADACRDAIAAVVRGLPVASGVIRPGSQNRWTWALLVDGVTVAVSGRDYDRQVRCEAARAQFVEYAAFAPIGPVVMITGARRSGAAPTLRRTALPFSSAALRPSAASQSI
jgi:hypothetical protein